MRTIVECWQPTSYEVKSIAEEFREITGCEVVTVFSPEYNVRAFSHTGNMARDWHQDQARKKTFGGLVLFWSNKNPTLIKEVASGKIMVPPAFSIVEIENSLYMHKINPVFSDSRWFVRGLYKRLP